MTNKIVYVSGMFRSGTTLLGKCVGSHPDIAFALDPFLEIFREIRNKTNPDSNFDPNTPFHHNFYEDMTWKKNIFPTVDFKEITLSKKEAKNLIDRIIRKSESYSPALCKKLKENNNTSTNIKEFFNYCFNAVEEVYGDNNTVYVGFKEVWGEEFAPALLNNYPQSKVIHITRDPRAVTSSKLAQKDHYPFLFLARFWRKTVTQSVLWSRIFEEFKDRYHTVYYENLICEPEMTLRDISKFLELDFSENMLNYQLPDKKANYAQGANSSYTTMLNQKGFVKEGINRWQKELSKEQIELIEYLTYPEIKYCKYTDENTTINPEIINNPAEISKEKIAEWLKPYELKLLTDSKYQKEEYNKEKTRHEIFTDFETRSDEEIEKYYYDKRYLKYLVNKI